MLLAAFPAQVVRAEGATVTQIAPAPARVPTVPDPADYAQFGSR